MKPYCPTLILLVLLLTACAPPALEQDHDRLASGMAEPVMDAPMAAPACQPGDDGIGGTGCTQQ